MRRPVPLVIALVALAASLATAPRVVGKPAVDPRAELAQQIAPWVDCWTGRTTAFRLIAKAVFPIDGRPQTVEVTYARFGEHAFDLRIAHADYAVELLRRHDQTALLLPKHRQAFVGSGDCHPDDCLAPRDWTKRLIGPGTSASSYLAVLAAPNAQLLATALVGWAGIERTAAGWQAGEVQWSAADDGRALKGTCGDAQWEVQLAEATGEAPPLAIPDDYRTTELARYELERQLARGFRRALEILAPSPLLANPAPVERQAAHGRVVWVDGHRVTLLKGTPEQIGAAHGELLREEAYRCIDSVLYTFGTFQTINTGRWFRHDLEAAYARLAPHIPERHKAETQALAAALGEDPDLIEAVNVFPELFHCSGFAVFGQATVDGKLYHGRVLDYMTTIGLQDASTTFIVAAEGQIPFANVGYAGFIGSVSGMNAEQISLGEMGGRGEGQWDGAPMATLMRRALEECDSLEEVKDLWRRSPRTCEYYYVFADGAENTAVGVAATPDSLQFVEPGAAHPLLGEGIPDAVVLSAGERLTLLRERVQQNYGKIDVAGAQALMCRPVAMKSNLHNVLFVPADGVLYVAHADHRAPAAERPYVKIDLRQWLAQLDERPQPAADAAAAQWQARDTLACGQDPQADAQACLEGLAWEAAEFAVTREASFDGKGDALLRFPSPRPSGDPANDVVALEWYMVKDAQGQPRQAPAAVVVHESGRGMTVGRMIARGLRSQGVHAFMIHLPTYGARRSAARPGSSAELVATMQQAIADVRRARDAVAALPAVDVDRISLQGTSLGGFVAATVAGLDQGYDQVFVLLAGGDLHGVVMNGKRDAENLRKDLRKAGLDEGQVKDMLAKIEPLRLAHRIDPESLWLYSGRFDDVVPPRHADLLAEAVGLPEQRHERMYADHYSGIVYLPYVLQQMGQRISSQ